MSPRASTSSLLTAALLLAGASASPAPAPAPAPAPQALSSAVSIFSSATGAAASALPTILGDWPSLSDIEKKLGLNENSSELSNISLSALLIPSYANLTDQGWNVRFYGLAYKLPNTNASDLDSLIDDLKTDNLNQTEQSLLQNRTQDLASIPIPGANLSAIVLANGTNITTTPISLTTTDDAGEFDQFVTIPGLQGQGSNGVQVVETGILNVTGPGNGSAILVPPQGISIVSDIDDVLRITKVYVPNQGLFNSFVEPYVNVPGMPALFAHWLQRLPNASFHYDTTTPVELTRTYVDYLFANFPHGSLEMRPINVSAPAQILDARQDSLLRLFQTFPQRKFVLVGDTSSSTLLSAYPQIAQQFPDQVACIFIRNTSATDADDKLPYSTGDFKDVRNGTYFFYRVPEDLFDLDVANGQCVNSSIPQNVTFGEQGGVLGNDSAAPRVRVGLGVSVVSALVAVMLGVGLF
ncbi:Phosphatidate phosphatase APP1 family protein [Phanerochaete sordida]|uniref:Phosphatidate phosphatase APP1 family protein n=1 Tax=Phanerochaete sordida TaxID=48140 RepID=A0A9P3LJN6_9APHY|nr:Phosphatidate phosphatase APP1 family protein [Phanerochaete sordida]